MKEEEQQQEDTEDTEDQVNEEMIMKDIDTQGEISVVLRRAQNREFKDDEQINNSP